MESIRDFFFALGVSFFGVFRFQTNPSRGSLLKILSGCRLLKACLRLLENLFPCDQVKQSSSMMQTFLFFAQVLIIILVVVV